MKRKEIIRQAINALALLEAEAVICIHTAKTSAGVCEAYNIAKRLFDAGELLKGKLIYGKKRNYQRGN